MTTIESLIEGFPKPTPTRINGLPTYKTIKKLNDDISTNAASIASDLGGGAHGHLAITVTPAIYATVSNVLFNEPENPQPPNINNLTAA